MKKGRRFDNIKTSLLRRVITVPRLSKNALNIYGEVVSDNGGVLEIEIPNGTPNTILLDANGIFNFGGIESSTDDISITKIIIDHTVVFDSEISGYNLKRVFSGRSEEFSDIGGNTPPFLVNEKIEIFGFNNGRTNGRWGREPGVLYIALVPIE